MSVEEYASNIVEKIGKANLNNVLKISDSVGADDFESLAIAILQKSAKIAPQTVQKGAIIINIVTKYLNLYRSDFKYNKQMIIDNCMMELCSAMR